jgi:BMFP domain-containing protein YqiC
VTTICDHVPTPPPSFSELNTAPGRKSWSRGRSANDDMIAAMTSLADLEARIAALEAERADYRAVLAAVGALGRRVDEGSVKTDANRASINALGEKLAGFQAETRARFDTLEQKIDANHHEATARFRSVDENLAEIRDLIVDRLGGQGQ